MAAIKIKMHEFDALSIKDSFDRRALQYKNRIVSALRKIGIKEDDVDIELEPVSVKSAPASAFWYISLLQFLCHNNHSMSWESNSLFCLKLCYVLF